jgi:hypothetical protein
MGYYWDFFVLDERHYLMMKNQLFIAKKANRVIARLNWRRLTNADLCLNLS